MISREKEKKSFAAFLGQVKKFINKKTFSKPVFWIKSLSKDHFSKLAVWVNNFKKDTLPKLANWIKNIKKDTLPKLVIWVKNISWKSPKTISVAFLSLVILVGGIFYLSITTSAVGIVVNGNTIGYAANMTEAKSSVQNVLKQQGEVAGIIAQTDDEIKYKRVRIKDEIYTAQMVSADLLLKSITPYAQGYGLKVGDKVAVVVATEQDIDSLLSKYKEYQSKPSANNIVTSAEFVETISKVAMKASPSQIKTVDDALACLLKGDVEETSYTVQKDDSLWLIARKNNMLTDDLIAGNPGFTEDTVIQPGQKITIAKVEPYLTVISKGTKVVNEVIPFDVVTKVDSKLGYGKSVVKQAGQDGEKVVTYDYVQENSSVTEKVVIKEEIKKEPVKQIIAKGPTPRAVYVGTSRGSGDASGISWPLSGPITSYYGYRWGGFHTGIDIDGVTGQPYYAAASGTVASAGWSGSYGYMIIIDHGNGVATRYAHSSKMLVSAGQHVDKGQNIGLVGSTGRSTGSHLHFEIIINGSTVNPLSYL